MIPCSLSESCVMDDEDDRRLLDIIGDVQALNDYLHGSTNKSIEEDDVTNAAYGSAGTFFTSNTAGSNSGLKDEEFEDSAGVGLQLSSSLSFIEDELGGEASPGGMDLGGGEDQPFDILQKSLMEADITEQTLEQEAMLDSQPPPPPLPSAPSPFPPQLVSGGYGSGVTTSTASFPSGQFLQGVSQLPNGQAGGHIQVLGSFGGGGVQQILLRQGGGVGGAVGGVAAGGQVFATPSPVGQVNQVGLPFKNIPLQNIIIQRGPGGAQALVRPIQPKPLQAGAQTVYSLGLQTTTTTMVNTAAQGHYTANGSILVHSPLGQQNQGQQGQANLPPGQYLVHHNGPSDPSQSTLLANQNTVQLVAGQNFTATAGGQLIQVGGSQVGVGGAMTQTWQSFPGTNPAPVQAASNQGRLTLVGTATGVRGQVSGSPVQRLVLSQTQNSSSLSPLSLSGTASQEQEYTQDKQAQTQLVNLLGNKAVKTMTYISQDAPLNTQVSAQKRPAPQQLTRGGMMLQQLRMDHSGVLSPDIARFTSLDDALHRLLPYHVFHGAPPNREEFSQVDDEFESMATQVLKRTQVMINKYRRLLMVEAERSSPSSEMVMIDRTFNQEERQNLTQDKRMILVDPDGFLEEFCCGVKTSPVSLPCLPLDPLSSPSSSHGGKQTDRGATTDPPYRTDPQSGYGDPGGGSGGGGIDSYKSIIDLKRTQHSNYGNKAACSNNNNNSNYHLGNVAATATAAVSTGTEQTQHLSHLSSHPQAPLPLPPTPPDTDSVLEAAVNSILEC
ncbi:BRD4-interacting chromatin-remodeling complex-associated protein-like [Salvelinus sp. IW2-2015]|uniref:BRD4-interacting chromatin-remodeling complex-associated protein-like n=1 Tax=Salvelinus sp. IW2-2015 TaxID=2691554 RepID=UPI000CDFA3D7|nr:BRD4-interacting chromatin-remodeling complex-associated protein-like isoform X1 [Salvelinus alpinus]XP_023848980.1 BRD4-interacting chromatin-remodeling complex-associated protein-like isoform X1 [Salvelinus alpinus]XP_023848981.1 BRD4-interacting chromatin-remodeling complex-associated protein-like isoform X1 [Salvelinus alpinus]XP_023848982.1 BRD4-interacting chromatin-remodeling complex-associated protein-like isoform X2 [Salvelinus alpinus]